MEGGRSLGAASAGAGQPGAAPAVTGAGEQGGAPGAAGQWQGWAQLDRQQLQALLRTRQAEVTQLQALLSACQ